MTGLKMGAHPCPPDDPDCLAKVEAGVDGVKLLYVKCGGGPGGAWGPCNPNGIGYRPQDLNATDPMTGRPWFEWRQVSLPGWSAYQDFLRTGNEAYLNQFVRDEGL